MTLSVHTTCRVLQKQGRVKDLTTLTAGFFFLPINHQPTVTHWDNQLGEPAGSLPQNSTEIEEKQKTKHSPFRSSAGPWDAHSGMGVLRGVKYP